MKKLFSLFLTVLMIIQANAQKTTAINLEVKSSLKLGDTKILSFQNDTNFIADTKVPTSLAVRKFITGRLAALTVGSITAPNGQIIYGTGGAVTSNSDFVYLPGADYFNIGITGNVFFQKNGGQYVFGDRDAAGRGSYLHINDDTRHFEVFADSGTIGGKRIALRATDSTGSPNNMIYQGADGLFHKAAVPAGGGSVAGLNTVMGIDSTTTYDFIINGSILKSRGGGALFWGFKGGSGTDPGDGNTGINVIGFGPAAATGNSANGVNAMGYQAAKDASGLGNINAFGAGAGKSSTAKDVNYLGFNAGINNSFNSVNLFGNAPSATANNQTVFRHNEYNYRYDYNNSTHDNMLTMPDSSGTLILRINGRGPSSKGDYSIAGIDSNAYYKKVQTDSIATVIRSQIAAITSYAAGVGMNTTGGTMNLGGDIGGNIVDIRSSFSNVGITIDPNDKIITIGDNIVKASFDPAGEVADFELFSNGVRLPSTLYIGGLPFIPLPANSPGYLNNDGFGSLSWQLVPSFAPVNLPNRYMNGYLQQVLLNADSMPSGATNKWFTNSLARAALSAGSGISYNSGTGEITAIGGGSTLSNIGSGFRLAVPGTSNVKTLFGGLWINIDSSANSNALTAKLDSAAALTFIRNQTRQQIIDSTKKLVVLSPLIISSSLTADTLKISGGSVDTTSLSNRILQRVRYTDTASMLTPYIRKNDTTVFARKLVTPFSIKVNNTNSAANETAVVYKSFSNLTYGGTVSFSAGTAPSGTPVVVYSWRQFDKDVKITITAYYPTAGATVSSATFTLPTDMPAPLLPTGTGSADDILYAGSGFILSTYSSEPAGTGWAWLKVNSAASGYECKVRQASSSARYFTLTVDYKTN